MGTDNIDSVKQKKNTPRTAWKAGQSGNPNGRPRKGMTLTDIAKEVLEEVLPTGITRKEALMKKVATLAYEGNETMIKLLWNYVDGMPVQKQQVESSGSIVVVPGELIKKYEIDSSTPDTELGSSE